MNNCAGCACDIAPHVDVLRMGRHWHEPCWRWEVAKAKDELNDWPRRKAQLEEVLAADTEATA